MITVLKICHALDIAFDNWSKQVDTWKVMVGYTKSVGGGYLFRFFKMA